METGRHAARDEPHLEASAVVGQVANAVQDEVDDLLADRVVPARVVVGGVLLARDELRAQQTHPNEGSAWLPSKQCPEQSRSCTVGSSTVQL